MKMIDGSTRLSSSRRFPINPEVPLMDSGELSSQKINSSMATYLICCNYSSLEKATTATRLSSLKTTTSTDLKEASHVRTLITLMPNLKEQDLTYTKYMESLTKVRSMLTHVNNQEEALMTIDSLKMLGIDYIFSQEINGIIDSFYMKYSESYMGQNGDLVEVTLAFRLLREAGYNVSSEIFDRFRDSKGEFNLSLSKDVRGILSLHDASYLNMGEEVLYKANEFAVKHLNSSISHLEPNLAALVRHSLDHPYYKSLQQYKARYHLSYRQRSFGGNSAIDELAVMDFNLNQLLHQKELKETASWWKNSGLEEELPSARSQLLKWYLVSMALLPCPQFSKYRVELTKATAFIYLIDDIYDVMGSLDELSLFTEAISKWEHPDTISQLPHYMKACYNALYDVTNQIADMISKEHGWNPINSLAQSWAKLCTAFMVEARWFATKHVPTASDYLNNGVISTGLHVVLEHIFFLLGEGITKETLEVIENNPLLISCPAKILRLWDDLGSAKDENQEGFDGSYVECYMRENPQCSITGAREHVMDLISKTWETLNKECFSPTPFSPNFLQACLNSARMVKVMYSYDDQQKLPMAEEYVKLLLFGEK